MGVEVFIRFHDDFNKQLNLDALIPKLSSKRLLTNDELDRLTLDIYTRAKKIAELVKIMSSKGTSAPAQFIQCLRDETEHRPHSELADGMENFLQEQSATPTVPPSCPSTLPSDPTGTRNMDPPHLLAGVNSSSSRSSSPSNGPTQNNSQLQSAPPAVRIDLHIHGPNVSTVPIIGSSPSIHTPVYTCNSVSVVMDGQSDNLPTPGAHPSSVGGASHVPRDYSLQGQIGEQIDEASFTPGTASLGYPVQEQSRVPYTQRHMPAQEESTGVHVSVDESVDSRNQRGCHPVGTRFPNQVYSQVPSAGNPTPPTYTQRHCHASNSLPFRNVPSSVNDNFLGNRSPIEELRQASLSYANLVDQLTTKLQQRGVTIGRALRELNNLLVGHSVQVAEEASTADIPSLFVCLRNHGLCHETDVDLLCALFVQMGLNDLHTMVKQYADSILGDNVLHHQNNVNPTDSHCLIFSHHSVSDMSIGEAYIVKDQIAEILQVPRHSFTLSSARIGSIALVWKVPNKYLKQAQQIKFEQTDIASVELEYLCGGEIKHQIVYTHGGDEANESVVLKSPDDIVSSTTWEFPTVPGAKRTARLDEATPSDIGPPLTSKPKLTPSLDEQQVTGTGLPNTSLPVTTQTRGSKRPLPSPNSSPPPSLRPRVSPPDDLQFTHSSPQEFARQYIPDEGLAPLVSTQRSRASAPLSCRYKRSDSIQVLADTLKTTYQDQNFLNRAAGPKTENLKFINLALVKKQGVSQSEKEKDDFLKNSLHGSIDDIVKKKEEIELQKIFEYGRQTRKLVLVEGAPGVGKTMLAMKICQMWADGDLLNKEYDLVFLVTLRRFQGKSTIELKDLISIALEGEVCEQASQDLFRSQGERMLIVLEGWDELPPHLREESSFFFDIVEGNKLPKASVLVTSRPTVTADLYDSMDERHIEVLGFSPDQIIEYVKYHGGEKVDTILGHFKKFPNVKALAHIPLTLSIICHVARTRSELPPTLTELYDIYICNALFQSLKKHRSEAPKTLIGVKSLESLPANVKSVIQPLCRLALDGFKEKKFVYSLEDLHQVSLKVAGGKSFDGYGLLTTPINSTVAGFEQVFQFRHLSIQEFLAAYGIQQLEYNDRVELLREYREDLQFKNIWKFFAGITKLEDKDFQRIVISETGQANRDQIFLLHCLFEANNPSISREAAEEMNRTLNLNNTQLTTTDCLCASHIITAAGGDNWVVDMRGCNIGEDGLRIFQSSLESHMQSGGIEFKIKLFNLTHNRITTTAAVAHLADMIEKNVHLKSINLASNRFGDAGMRILAGALADNTTTTFLHFSSCELTSTAAVDLAEMLEKNRTLTDIYLGFEPLGCHGVSRLAAAMKINDHLTELSLTNTDMTSVGLSALADMAEVNHTLEVLRLDRNELRTEDCELVVKIIEKSTKLTLLDLSKNPIGDEGFGIILDTLIAKPSSSLKKLSVFGCGITHEGLEKLVVLFTVTENFVGMQLGCNVLGDKGAELIGEALLKNAAGSKTVKQVLLESTEVSEEGKQKLKEICDTLNAERERDDKIDLNYLHHSQVVQKRNSTNYI